MRGHLAEPFDAAVLHGGGGVEALSDGVGDDGLTLLLQEGDQLLLLRHQRVNLARLPVKESCDGSLFSWVGTVRTKFWISGIRSESTVDLAAPSRATL